MHWAMGELLGTLSWNSQNSQNSQTSRGEKRYYRTCSSLEHAPKLWHLMLTWAIQMDNVDETRNHSTVQCNSQS